VNKTLPALIIASAVIIAACGGDDGTPATTPDTTPATTPATTAPQFQTNTHHDGSAVPADDIDRDATIRVSYFVGPTSFDPAISSSSFDSPSYSLVYDRVVHLSPNADVVPGLAESWDFSEDGSKLTMKLRSGMKFHDGNPVDAAAVAANLGRNKAGSGIGDLAAMERIEVVDELIFTITFNRPAGAWPAVLADRAGSIASPAAFGEALDLRPVGAGMYKVVEYVKNARIIYERFEDYWDPEVAAAARVEYVIIPDNVAAFNSLLGGQTDWGPILATQIAEAKANGLTVISGLALNIHHLQFNRSRPFLNDVNVRRAISMAVNRDGYVEDLLRGLGSSSSQPFPAGYWGNNPEVEIPEYNPDKAREMLRGAGVPEGHKFDMVVPNTNVYPLIAEAVRNDLLAVGIEAEIRLIEGVQTAPIFYSQASGDVLMSVFGGRFDPAQHFGLLYAESARPNPGGVTWPALDELLPAVLTGGPPETRQPAVHAASKIVSDDAVNVILHHPFSIFAFNNKVRGAELWLIGRPEFRGLGIAAE
jgi:peptide/nickel transport system substrate-binding protein